MTSQFHCGLGFPDVAISRQQQQQRQQIATATSASSTGNTARDEGSRQSNVTSIIKVPVLPGRTSPAADAAARTAVRNDPYLAYRLVSLNECENYDDRKRRQPDFKLFA